jgi:hypothetical protein
MNTNNINIVATLVATAMKSLIHASLALRLALALATLSMNVTIITPYRL